MADDDLLVYKFFAIILLSVIVAVSMTPPRREGLTNNHSNQPFQPTIPPTNDPKKLFKAINRKRYVKSYNVADNGIYGLENIDYNKVVPNISVKGKISFQTPKNNNTDNYTLRKVIHGVDKSSLRLTINDNSDEVFEIWGDSCANGGCGGEGAVAHKFTADGNAWHKGGMTADVTNVNHIKLGNKWSLSGVGDKDGNDDWLRLFNKDGTGYYGGLAAGKLLSGGVTHLNGPTYTKNITASGNLNVNGGNANVCVDGACITKGDINTFKSAKGSISQLQHDLTATTSLAKTQQKVSAENEITIAKLQQKLSATTSLARAQQTLSAINEINTAKLQQELSATTSLARTQRTLSAMNERSIAQLQQELSETKAQAKALAKAQAQAQAQAHSQSLANAEALARANASNAEAHVRAAHAHSQSRANAEALDRAHASNAEALARAEQAHSQSRVNAKAHALAEQAHSQSRANAAKALERANAANAAALARANAANAQARTAQAHEQSRENAEARAAQAQEQEREQAQDQARAAQAQAKKGCYGAKTGDCNTCSDVINAYKARGWKYNQNDFDQCKA
jgi:hypothetical protein